MRGYNGRLWIFGMVQERAQHMAEERAERLGIQLHYLLTPEEEAVDQRTSHLRFDIPLLAERLVYAVDWLAAALQVELVSLEVFGRRWCPPEQFHLQRLRHSRRAPRPLAEPHLRLPLLQRGIRGQKIKQDLYAFSVWMSLLREKKRKTIRRAEDLISNVSSSLPCVCFVSLCSSYV